MDIIKIELTKQDINNLLLVLNKVSITGSEAMAVAQLQIKFSNALAKQEQEQVKEPKKK